MRRSSHACLLLAALLVLTSCSSRADPSITPAADGSESAAAPDEASMQLDCEREGYPCDLDEVAPEVRQRESAYVADIVRRLDEGASYPEALAWALDQDGVVAGEAGEHELFFRLAGGQPVSISEIVTEQGSQPAEGMFDAVLAGVVGHGTNRANKQNLKRALLLDPLSAEIPSGFSLVRPGLAALRDYNHAGGVEYQNAAAVTPASFAGWTAYDAIFVATHGSASGGSWLATGVYEALEAGDEATFNAQCDELMEAGWKQTYRARCAVFAHRQTVWVGVVVPGDYFTATYGRTGGLKAAIVYIGGCNGMQMTGIRDSLAGSSSAYVSWTAMSVEPYWQNATANLLFGLIKGQPVAQARDTVCGSQIGCRVPDTGAVLDVHGSADARKLRLYDLPTFTDPKAPTNVLQDGARLDPRIHSDESEPDELELVVDLIGIIDPDDTSGGSGPDARLGEPAITLASTRLAQDTSDVASKYNLRIYVDDDEVVADNLGRPHPKAEVTPLGQDRYRYTVTAELPFKVDPEEETEVTLKVEVDLPEGGISDYEVRVILGGCAVTPNGLVVPFDLPPDAEYIGEADVGISGYIAESWRVGSAAGAYAFMRNEAMTTEGYRGRDAGLGQDPDDPMWEGFGLIVQGPCWPGGGGMSFIQSSTMPPTMTLYHSISQAREP